MTHDRHTAAGRRILVVQQLHSGHRLMYVRLVAQQILDYGDIPLIALTAEARKTSEFRLHLAPILERVSVVALNDFTIHGIERLSMQLRADRTVLLEGDAFRSAVALRGWRSGDLAMLIMRPESQKVGVRGLPFLRTFIKRSLLAAAGQRKNVEVFTLVSGSSTSVEPSEVRDPIVITGTSRDHADIGRRTGLDDDRKWFGIVGAVGARKNPLMVLAAARTALGAKDAVLLAGTIDSSIDKEQLRANVQALEVRGVRVLVLDRLLDDLELDGLLANLDCVVLAHSNEGSSGILGKAAALGTSVLAAGARSLRQDVASVPGGLWVPLNEESLADGLRAMKTQQPPLRQIAFQQHSDGLIKLLDRTYAS